MTDGRYISEKDPGYPFLAAPFEKAGVIRLAPLFYGALACLGSVHRRPALARALRRVRSGRPVLLIRSRAGVRLARLHADVHRRLADRGGFRGAAVGGAGDRGGLSRGAPGPASPGSSRSRSRRSSATPNIVILGCAVVAVIVAWRLRAAKLPLRTLCWWLASVVVFGAGVAIFDDLVYGGPLTTGYQPGEVTFGLGAISHELRIMPAHLMQAMPMLVFGLVALAWIIVRWLVLRRAADVAAAARRDLWVGLALAASWFAIWGLYSAYTWTTDPTEVTVQVVRFYVPAIGAISLLGAWLVTRIPGRACVAGLTQAAVIAAMFVPGRVVLPRDVRGVRCPAKRLTIDALEPDAVILRLGQCSGTTPDGSVAV